MHVFLRSKDGLIMKPMQGTEVEKKVNHKLHEGNERESEKITEQLETLVVTTGVRKTTEVKKDGWDIIIEAARGHSAERFNATRIHEGRDGEKTSHVKQRSGRLFSFASQGNELRDLKDI
jgi:hypothetical protein